MLEEYIFAGFGGQGIMTIGTLLAYAGMLDGYESAWIPSYGPESRGGTANCSVVISDDVIGSPHPSKPNGLIIMNAPSFEKFEPKMVSGGLMVVNSSIVPFKSKREDITAIYLPCAEIAVEVGSALTISVVALGAFNQVKKVVKDESIERAIDWILPEHRKKYLDVNLRAYYTGKEKSKDFLKIQGLSS